MNTFEVAILSHDFEKDTPKIEKVYVMADWFMTETVSGSSPIYAFYMDPDDDSDPFLVAEFPFAIVQYVRMIRRQ